MTKIDPTADIDLHTANDQVIVRVPLVGLVSDGWLWRYERLARASGVPVEVQADPQRAWIVVDVPASGSYREVTATPRARLIADLLAGGPETNSASSLISVGFGVWLYTILAFAFLYWVVDGGGPDARLRAPPAYPRLAFPEQLNPVVSPPGWRPQFLDYLYLGLTNATAFSPTDGCRSPAGLRRR